MLTRTLERATEEDFRPATDKDDKQEPELRNLRSDADKDDQKEPR